MESPHHPLATLMSHYGKLRGKIAVDVVEMNHIGVEIIEYLGKRPPYVAPAEHTPDSGKLCGDRPREINPACKVGRPIRGNILGKIHREYGSLIPLLTEQTFEIDNAYAISTARVIKLVDDEYSRFHSLLFKRGREQGMTQNATPSLINFKINTYYNNYRQE